jgi:hypothetical protein
VNTLVLERYERPGADLYNRRFSQGGEMMVSSLGFLAVNGLVQPERFDIVFLVGFDPEDARIDIALLRGQMRDRVPFLRLDPL